jgi:hypothetical protein
VSADVANFADEQRPVYYLRHLGFHLPGACFSGGGMQDSACQQTMKSIWILLTTVAVLALGGGCGKKDKLQIKSASSEMRQMMQSSGMTPQNATPSKTWEVFKRFAKRPVDCEQDGLLFECGTSEFQGKPVFIFDFVRQFEIEKRGEPELHQVHVDFRFELAPEFEGLKTNKWSSDFKDADEFFQFVEGLREFRTVLDSEKKPVGFDITQIKID